MDTPVSCRWVARGLFALVLFLATGSVHAQLRIDSDPNGPVAVSDQVSVYLTWTGEEAIEGLVAEIPPEWTLKHAQLSDQKGHFSQHVEARRISRPGAWSLRSEGIRIENGQRIRLLMATAASSTSEVDVAPLVKEGARWEMRSDLSVRTSVRVQDRSPSNENKALVLSGDIESSPLIQSTDASPRVEGDWTLAWWVRSTGLDQIMLSAWSGFETDGYPLEAILDAAGHVTVFTGRDHRHFAMRSSAPIADGSWRHLAVVHDAAENRMRLHVDGVPQDSLQFDEQSDAKGAFPPLGLGYRLERSREDLSDPLIGALDELTLFASPLDRHALNQLRKQSRVTGLLPAWKLDFVDSEQVAGRDDTSNPEIRTSILSFRRGASSLTADRTPEGLMVSFLKGDEEVERYVIEASFDGERFTQLASIEPLVQGGTRIQWVDRTPRESVIHYRVMTEYADGPGDASPILKVGMGTDESVSRVHLEGNFPNPFNPTTTIRYEVLESEHVRISIWDLAGQMIAQPVDGNHQPGSFEVAFDAGSLPSGTYFVRLESPSGIQTHQMILMK